MAKRALVTGANKDIGLEIARELGKNGFEILLGARDEGRGVKAVEELSKEGIIGTLKPMYGKVQSRGLAERCGTIHG